jgi:tight adherence protein C
MDSIEILFMLLVFVTTFLVITFLLLRIKRVDYSQRLRNVIDKSDDPTEKTESDFAFKVVKVMDPLAKLSTPKEGWDKSPLRIQFINAGWRNEFAPKLFFGFKTLLTITIPLLLFFLFRGRFDNENAVSMMAPLLLSGAAIGLVLPKIYLNHKTEKRKNEIFHAFPDALDLLIICMEAGLSFDQALARVSKEIKIKSEILHQDLELILLETRTGVTREKALRNFSLRTGVEEIETFASMIIQAERFGTSISDSLRVHSEEFRLKRKQKAEEMAAKIPVKLLFPLAFLMLPTVLFIMVGPSAMQVFQTLK